jgi:hypothetical protein
MKPTGNYYMCIFVLTIAGVFVYLPVNAQDSNMKFWEFQDYVTRTQTYQQKVVLNYIFMSRVINDSDLEPVSYCNIINKTQNTGTVSDINGDFKISANVNDSIKFRALGYESLTIVLSESMYNYGFIIKLKPTTYEIEELIIEPIVEKPLVTKWEVYTKPLPNQGGINIPTGISPISLIYDNFSKEAKQKKYHKKLIYETHDFMIIAEKFNGAMVAQLTGLKDDELIDFMSFCNFSKDFLLNYSYETIKRSIRKKYQEYIEL